MAEHKQAIIRPVSDFASHMPRPTIVSLVSLSIALAGMAIGSAARSEGSIPSSALVSTGVEASLPMADQVVVMTPRPGRVARVVAVDLPRPRPASMTGDPRAAAVADEVREALEASHALELRPWSETRAEAGAA